MNYKPQLKIWSVEQALTTYRNQNIIPAKEQVTELSEMLYDAAYAPEQDWLSMRNRMAEMAESMELDRVEEFKDYLSAVHEQRDAKENRAAINAACNAACKFTPKGAA